MKIDQYNQSIWDSFPHLTQEQPQMSSITSRFFRRKARGDSARHESAEPGSAEFAAGIERIAEYLAALSVALSVAQTEKEKLQRTKEACSQILEICGRVEERVRRSQSSNGEAAQDAQVQKVIQLTGGLQLVFDLYCIQCHFQCWSCPKCDRVRCACSHGACGCEVD